MKRALKLSRHSQTLKSKNNSTYKGRSRTQKRSVEYHLLKSCNGVCQTALHCSYRYFCFEMPRMSLLDDRFCSWHIPFVHDSPTLGCLLSEERGKIESSLCGFGSKTFLIKTVNFAFIVAKCSATLARRKCSCYPPL